MYVVFLEFGKNIQIDIFTNAFLKLVTFLGVFLFYHLIALNQKVIKVYLH